MIPGASPRLLAQIFDYFWISGHGHVIQGAAPPPYNSPRLCLKPTGDRVWAPEIHWLGARWALVHCPKGKANLALSAGPEIKGPWKHPLGENVGLEELDN